MNEFFVLALSGAVSGALYAVLAGGLVLTYSTTRIFNFSHGALAFTTGFLYYELARRVQGYRGLSPRCSQFWCLHRCLASSCKSRSSRASPMRLTRPRSSRRWVSWSRSPAWRSL